MTIEEYRKLIKEFENKYGAKKTTTIDGKTFDSIKEANRYTSLLLLQRAGVISDLQTQVKFVLIPTQRDAEGKLLEKECSYKADFVYKRDGETVVEDTKGFKTPEYIIKRKLMLHIHNIRIQEI
jgi:hypothetical protein